MSKYYLAFILAAAGCMFQHEAAQVSIRNESSASFDSVVVHINAYRMAFAPISLGTFTSKTANVDSIEAAHDVVYQFQVYRHDSLLINDFQFITDLGGVPS